MFSSLFGPSCLDNIDSAARLAAAALASVIVACMQRQGACLAGLGLGILIVCAARPFWGNFLARILAINAFIAFIWLVVPFTAGGESYAQFGFLQISREGVRLSWLATLKANAIFCIFMGLVGSMSPTTLGCALKKLHCPDKLALLFLFMGRAFHIIGAEWRELVLASRLRGFEPAFNRHTYRTIGSLLGVLLVKSQERSERMQEAMLLRGFDGNLRLSCPWTCGRQNYVFGLFILACLVCLCFLEWGIADA